MEERLTAEDAKASLNEHVARKGAEVFEKYGPRIGWSELGRMLEDRACVRYPCTVVFDGGELQPGELAYPMPMGKKPEDGFKMCVHPRFASRREIVPRLVLYQLVVVNYGVFASSEDAETFGAAALGVSRDEYYRSLCELADQLESAT